MNASSGITAVSQNILPRGRRFTLLFLIAILASITEAQEFRASLAGTITDPAGMPIRGAVVTVQSLERNVVAEEITNRSGRYVVQFLTPGKYKMTISNPGFRTFVQAGITLSSIDRVQLDVVLQLGSPADTVTVTTAISLLQTDSASRSTLIENKAIEEIPTNGRNLYQLQYTIPGVIKNSTYWGAMELYAFSNMNGVSISGGRQN